MSQPPDTTDHSPSSPKASRWRTLLHSWKELPKAAKIGVIAGLVLILGAVLSSWGVKELNRPMGPTLPPLSVSDVGGVTPDADLPTPVTVSTAQATASPAAMTEGGNPTPRAATMEPSAVPTARPKPVCGGPEQMMIMGIGVDTSDPAYEYGLADVIRITRVDFVEKRVGILTIPRHLWVPVPALSSAQGQRFRNYFGVPIMPDGEEYDPPGYHGRINASWFYGNLYDLPGLGPGTLADVLHNSFNIPIEHYFAVNMQMVVRGVNAIGGLDVDLPEGVAIPAGRGEPRYFPAGYNHMTGEDVLLFARHRRTDSDWFRYSRQTILILALREKLLQPRIVNAIPDLIDAYHDEVFTDLSKAQLLQLACLMTRLTEDDITIYPISESFVTTVYTTRGSQVYVPHDDEIQERVNMFIAGSAMP